MKILFTLIWLTLFLQTATAQLDLQCNGLDRHSIYLVTNDSLFRMDSVDTQPSDPKRVMFNNHVGVSGICINKNLDQPGRPVTMYGVNDYTYYYWDSSKWINTNHSTGYVSAKNPGGAGNHIFSMDGNNGNVYSYNGKGSASELFYNINNSTGRPIYDLATDTSDNFYVYYTGTNQIVMYDSIGLPVDTMPTLPQNLTGNSLPGFALLGNNFYAFMDNVLYRGVVASHQVTFTPVKTISAGIFVLDIATCPSNAGVVTWYKNPLAPHFVVYPNPASDNATIKMNNTEGVVVYDCLGRLKLSVNTTGLTVYTIPLLGWVPGIYFLTATSPGGQAGYRKLIVK